MILLPWHNKAKLVIMLAPFNVAYSLQWKGYNHTATLRLGSVKIRRIRPALAHVKRLGLPVC
jgi:hypothetical protein